MEMKIQSVKNSCRQLHQVYTITQRQCQSLLAVRSQVHITQSARATTWGNGKFKVRNDSLTHIHTTKMKRKKNKNKTYRWPHRQRRLSFSCYVPHRMRIRYSLGIRHEPWTIRYSRHYWLFTEIVSHTTTDTLNLRHCTVWQRQWRWRRQWWQRQM